MLQFILNNTHIRTDLPPGTTVLDFVRYHQHLTGTKIGCREGDCGACTVLVGKYTDDAVAYQSMTACLLPLDNVRGKYMVTVEGINSEKPNTLTAVQEALVAENGTQCGFCTVGFGMSLTGHFLQENTSRKNMAHLEGVPYLNANEEAISAMDGNICRCTGYKSIERAAARCTRTGAPLAGALLHQRWILPLSKASFPPTFRRSKRDCWPCKNCQPTNQALFVF